MLITLMFKRLKELALETPDAVIHQELRGILLI
jgi:hypothetical protein